MLLETTKQRCSTVFADTSTTAGLITAGARPWRSARQTKTLYGLVLAAGGATILGVTVETPKRLAARKETIQNLFARSGNQCAYPSCTHELITDDDIFVAEVRNPATEEAYPRSNLDLESQQQAARPGYMTPPL